MDKYIENKNERKYKKLKIKVLKNDMFKKKLEITKNSKKTCLSNCQSNLSASKKERN